MSVDAPCPDSDLPATRTCTSTWPRLSPPGVTDWIVRFNTSMGRSTTAPIAAMAAAIGPLPLPALLRADDLVRRAVLKRAVRGDARLVRECIAAHDRLVRLGEDADDVGQELAGAEDLLRVPTALECHGVGAHPTRHHDLLECGVAGAFPDAVDRALHLAGAGLDAGERVGDREAQVVVTMGAEHHLIAV